ncbi:hypothetical protein AYM40_35375 [Paraburkholderia phytofirmans OLGA172]|uniref:Integrase n=1 Tax=Paraburkholderia phytofirmans OLGA172 TaxID=1417228 RepID=A0A160FVH5_9BURK|nr:hypothetical protein [Paraburkholderia phytofirmans]ANB77359.1 hypothetical protein AYM40_35375 [Paraburkholderia phytofirmans OLGA172]
MNRGTVAGLARRILLPQFTLTEVSHAGDPDAYEVSATSESYFVRPTMVPVGGIRRDGKPRWVKHRFNLFPIVLDRHGVPWAEAEVYLLARMQGTLNPLATTFMGIGDDLASYRRFLDEEKIDWLEFPSLKQMRPTYRFSGHLTFCVKSEELSASTARRRMGTVVSFYRWLITEEVFEPAFPAWKERDVYINISDARGFRRLKKVSKTDVSISAPKQRDSFDGYIDDGGKLRPLPLEEQEWLVDALVSIGNIEMVLIHIFALVTGARIQTVLTIRVRHVLMQEGSDASGEIRMPVGAGTGIDTKNDKQMVLHVPRWFYSMLSTYAMSERATRRRSKAKGGDAEDQYLFLSERGAPFYRSKEEAIQFDDENDLRHMKAGQAVRQFIRDRVLPFIREKYNVAHYHYRFHDTRATAGMNWTDAQMKLVTEGEITLQDARKFVAVRMGHDSTATTDGYLQYRRNLKMVREVKVQQESHLKTLTEKAMAGLL